MVQIIIRRLRNGCDVGSLVKIGHNKVNTTPGGYMNVQTMRGKISTYVQ